MLKKMKLSKDDYSYLFGSELLSAWNTSGRIAADLIAAGNDNVTAVWYSHIWWMLDLCQHYLDIDSREMTNKLYAIWNGLRMPKNDGTDEPFPKIILAEVETGQDELGTKYGRDFLTIRRHILSEREYLLNLIYEVVDGDPKN